MMKTLHSALLKFSLLLFTFAIFNTAQAADPAKGEQIFKTNCTSCHDAKFEGTLIGPNLKGVKARWKDEKKLHAFIKNSQAVINSGDSYAKGLLAQFNGVLMPPQDLTDEQIADVVAYVDAGGTQAAAPAGGPTAGGGGAAYAPVPADDSWLRWIGLGILALLLVIFFLSSKLLKSVFGLNVDKEDGKKAKSTVVQNLNAIIFPIFLILWFGLMIWETMIHTTPEFMRPEAASDTGAEIDRLFDMTLIVTAIVFVLTQVLLFWYAFRYRHKEGKKGYYYPHNNTVEFIWTSIPAVVLAALVLYGFKTWQKATGNPDDNPLTIEAFAKQFDWTFRYPGPDGKLGRTDFLKIDPGANPLGIDFTDPASKDDYIVTELHLPVNRDIYLKLRSQDVTHAAYLVHFRAQMYANPGMDTRMRFKPTITTADMRLKTGNANFNYELACNQLCGAAHFNMRRLVIVEKENEFQNWQKDKKPAFDKVKDQQTTASK
ncbi:MAG: c-type cytochrome [Bacteroidia bacterium]